MGDMHLIEELEQALLTGKLKQFRSKLEKVDLMILDDLLAKKAQNYCFKLAQSFMNKRV